MKKRIFQSFTTGISEWLRGLYTVCRSDPIAILSSGVELRAYLVIPGGGEHIREMDWVFHGPTGTTMPASFPDVGPWNENVSYVADLAAAHYSVAVTVYGDGEATAGTAGMTVSGGVGAKSAAFGAWTASSTESGDGSMTVTIAIP